MRARLGRAATGLWLVALALPLRAAMADPQGEFARARAADLAGDSAKAFLLYLDAARAGLPDAQFAVATMYDSGRGAAQSTQDAALYYALAASNGHGQAAYNLGLFYQSGDGVPRNPAMARAWFQAAKNAGVRAAGARLRPIPAQLAASVTATPPVAALLYPAADAVIDASQDFVPLVWAAPDGASPTAYYVQVATVDRGSARDVLTSMTDLSAIRARIGHSPAHYAWRVFTVTQGHYAATEWERFSVAETARK